MMINNKVISALAVALLVAACGSNTKDEEANVPDNGNEAAQQVTDSNPKENSTKLVATPINTEERLKEHEMVEIKDKLKGEYSGWQRGRVQFLNLEGGFYGIITDSGKKLLPMNMKKEFAQNGAIVRVKGKVKNIMTIQQWGTPFTITEIELISPGTIGNPADR